MAEGCVSVINLTLRVDETGTDDECQHRAD